MSNTVTIFSGKTGSGKTDRMMAFVKDAIGKDIYPIIVTPHPQSLMKYSSYFLLGQEEGIRIFCNILSSRIAGKKQEIVRPVLCAIDEFGYFAKNQPDLITTLWQVANTGREYDVSLCLATQDTSVSSLRITECIAHSSSVSIVDCNQCEQRPAHF